MTAHEDLLARHRAVMPSWLGLAYDEPISLVSGSGCEVVDAEGNRYLDFFGGILTTMVGHAVPEVVDAISTQAGRIIHSSTRYLIEPMLDLAERIADLSGIPEAKVFFTTSGTEANEAALLLATVHRRSNEVFALRGGYHGRSFATMGATGTRSWSSSALSPLVVHYLHNGYRMRSPFRDLDDRAFTRAIVADLVDLMHTAVSGDVAAMIVEPIQGVGGNSEPPAGTWGAVQEVLRRHGVLYISDEVQTGWGRTGDHFWGYQAHGVQPDLLTFAKGVGNGVPLAGVVGRPEVMDAIDAYSISTFGGGPLVAAAGLATIDLVVRNDLQGNARRQGARIRSQLEPLVDELAAVAEVRGRGLMLGVELVEADGFAPAPLLGGAVSEEARRRGLLVGLGGLHGNCLRIAPPLSVSADEAEQGASILADAIRAVCA